MDDLVTWLRAQLDADEAVARAVRDPRWRSDEREGTLTIDTGPESQGWRFGGGSGVWQCDDPEDDCREYRSMAEAEVSHIARHDPASVLRDVAAKRAIVDEAARLNALDLDGLASGPEFYGARTALGQTIRHLAAAYADRGGYRPEWSPSS